MRLQDEFTNGIDRMNKIAYSLIGGNAKVWASKAERKGIISISDKIEIENLVNLRNLVGHGGAGRVYISPSDMYSINNYIRIMNNTANRFRNNNSTKDMPEGAFRSYIKELNFNGSQGRQHYFKFEIVHEYQERSYDDGSRFRGTGYTVYVLDAPYRSWCIDNNSEYEFHYYAYPRGYESICWNRLITSFEDANKIMYVWAKRYVKIIETLLDQRSVNIGSYDSVQKAKYNVPVGTFRSRTIKITEEVFNQIKATIGTLKPEQGGILGINNETDTVVSFVHDKNARVGYAEYNPNVEFLNNVINNDWLMNKIDFYGFVHSHPYPSYRLSDADIEYAKLIMKEFDLAYLYMPLVNSSAEDKFKLHNYVVHRNGRIEKCELEIVKPVIEELELDFDSDLSEDEIMNFFEQSKVNPVKTKEDTQYERVESCLPLNHLKDAFVIGIGCGGARELYIDMARMGVMNFVLMDGDNVSITNISSQNVYLDEVGLKKVDVIKERISNINKDINVQTFPIMLDDNLDDQWLEVNIISKVNNKPVILCAFTDSFVAQARIANIAVKYNLPLIAAQHHQYGNTSEIVYWYPGLSMPTPKSVLSARYEAYKKGYKNTVTSDGSPIFNTVRLNALCEKIAMGLLLYSHNKYGQYSNRLLENPNKNLVLIKQNDLLGTTSNFVSLFNNRDILFDEPIWIENEPEDLYSVIDTRIIF